MKAISIPKNYIIHKEEVQKGFYKCRIEFKNASKINKILIQSIQQLQNCHTPSSFQKIEFKCLTLTPLYQHLSNQKSIHIMKIIYDLTLQLKYLLEETNHTFLGLNPKHILVVDGNTFIYLLGEHLRPIKDNQSITFDIPYTPNDFIYAPEIYDIKMLPCEVYYKCSYFSIGVLFLHILFYTNKSVILMDARDVEELTHFLTESRSKGIKLYYFLKRCLSLNEPPDQRSILFI